MDLLEIHIFKKIKKKFFWPQHVACRTSVIQLGIELMPLAVEAQNLNHWTAREVPEIHILDLNSRPTKSQTCELRSSTLFLSKPLF